MDKKDYIKVRVEQITPEDESEVIIRSHQLSPELKQVIAFLKGDSSKLVADEDEDLRLIAYEGDKIFQLTPEDIFYIESVDKRTFIYGENKVYESKTWLYELEVALTDFDFFRVSKSMLVNLGKVQSFAPTSSRRFEAIMQNGEKILISRHYVSKLKKLLNI